jgi:hypothetical protein
MNQAQRRELESVAKDNLRYAVHCKGCGQIYGYKTEMLVSKPLDDWLIEVGIHCPRCNLFHRAYWMNAALVKLRGELGEKPDRKGARRFTHEFRKLQNRMRLKNAIRPDQTHPG